MPRLSTLPRAWARRHISVYCCLWALLVRHCSGLLYGADPVDFNCWKDEWNAPTLCPQRNDFWPMASLMAALPEFSQLYAERPIKKNTGGMNINHGFSLWFTVRMLKPKHIIESGIFKGQSTWLLRHAAPEANIYSLDPNPNQTYRDNSSRAHYLVGDNFSDFAEMDWASLIPMTERESTLVVLDDHQNCLKRTRQLLAEGFVHLWFDDNCRACEEKCGRCDMYSFNMLCSPVPPRSDGRKVRTIVEKDDFGRTKRTIGLAEHSSNLQFLLGHLEIYFEFPPIFDGCPPESPRYDANGMLSNKTLLATLGLPSIREEIYNYGTRHPPYVKLRK